MCCSSKLRIFIFFINLINAGTLIADNRDPRSNIDYYIDVYEVIEFDDTPLATRARQIFSDIKAVADKKAGHTSKFKILKSESSPHALSLPDGYVLLSNKALELCYRNVSRQTGDARLAFIIGHELAHMSNSDFWHQDVYLSLSGDPGDQQLENLKRLIQTSEGFNVENNERNWQVVALRRELEADDVGFIYATIAGFDTDLLLKLNEHNEDFLKYWVKHTRSQIDQQHLGPADRSRFLRARLQGLREKTEIFHYGVRLAHFGRYRDARYFFNEFLSILPTREVLNNLGYCHLQLARELMGVKHANKYWFPTLLEVNSSGFSAVKSLDGSTELDIAITQHLKNAVDYLRRANEVDRKYLPAHLNLAVTYSYLGEFHEARAVIESARKLAPQDPAVQGLRALILYWQEKDVDMWPTAIKILESIASEENVPAHIIYNLAKLFEERGRHGQANIYWKRLALRKAVIPLYRYTEVCNRLNNNDLCTVVSMNHEPDLPKCLADTNRNIYPGVELTNRFIRRYLQDWNQTRLQSGHYKARVFRHKSGRSLLAFNHVVDMIVVPTKAKILSGCDFYQQSKQTISNGQISSYGNVIAIHHKRDGSKELWQAKP